MQAPRRSHLVFLVLVAGLPAQDWRKRIPAGGSPPALVGSAMVYDSVRNESILFGGATRTPLVRRNDTWSWNGTAWTQRTPPSSPPVRDSHAMAFDRKRGRVVMFGGYSSTSYLSDVWEWDGTTWTQVQVVGPSPSARAHHAMAFDEARGVALLFGGEQTSGPLNDTWEWNGLTWRQVTPTTSPPLRTRHGLAYDRVRQRVVLFGGLSPASSPLADTWEWDGVSWVQKSSATSGRYMASLAYDSLRQRTVLYGGHDQTNYLTGTWQWDGSSWSVVSTKTSPPPLADQGADWDSARGVLVMFGGDTTGTVTLAETWELDPASAAFPVTNAASEGNSSLSEPFAAADSRLQWAMRASHFAGPKTGLIRALGFRRDQGTQPFAARTLNLTVTLAAAPVLPEQLSTSFAANLPATRTVVSLPAFNLPGLSAQASWPAEFALHLPLVHGFWWGGQDLLCEIEGRNNSLSNGYEIDAAELPRPLATRYGAGCNGGMPLAPRFVAPFEPDLVPGGKLLLGVDQATSWTGNAALCALGVARLTPPLCIGECCIGLTLDLVPLAGFVSATGTAQLAVNPIPNQPNLIGARLYSQWAISNGAAGFVVSDAMELRFGQPAPIWFDAIRTTNPSQGQGTKHPTSYVTPVVRLVLD